MQTPFFIIISGPTGVGKTDFVNKLVTNLPFQVECINADVGQFYVPLAIGTAKPDYASEPVKQHFFDIIDQPGDFTVSQYRERLLTMMKDMWSRSVVPLIVGGSGFYVNSIFFPPTETSCTMSDSPQIIDTDDTQLLTTYKEMSAQQLWEQLHTIDPVRAASIHPHDRYRVERALVLWQKGCKPSEQIPLFDAPAACAIYFLTRDRDELYERINQRTDRMLNAGWIEEVTQLSDEWKQYLLKKRLIGYPEIITFLDDVRTRNIQQNSEEYAPALYGLSEVIKRSTRAYAKRQLTYWRMLKKKLMHNDPQGAHIKIISELNLTISSLDLYIERVIHELSALYNKSKERSMSKK